MSAQPVAMQFGDVSIISPDGEVPAHLWPTIAALQLLDVGPDLAKAMAERLEASMGVREVHRAFIAGGMEAVRDYVRGKRVSQVIVDEFSRLAAMPFPGEAPAPTGKGHPLTVVERDANDSTRWRRVSAIHPGDERLSWYLVRAATRQENRAEANLIEAHDSAGRPSGFAVYVPRLTYWRRIHRIRHRCELSLFGGYIFVGVAPGQALETVVDTEGVHDLVRFAGKARPIPFDPIAALVHDEIEGEHDRTRRDKRRDPKPGTPVTITGGMFAGWPARFVERREDERIALLLTMFGRDVNYALEPEDVELPEPPQETQG